MWPWFLWAPWVLLLGVLGKVSHGLVIYVQVPHRLGSAATEETPAEWMAPVRFGSGLQLLLRGSVASRTAQAWLCPSLPV